MNHAVGMLWILAQITEPSPSDGSGTPFAELRRVLDPLLSGAMGILFTVVLPAVILAGGFFWLVGSGSGNTRHLGRGRSMLIGAAAALLAMKVTVWTANYFA